MLSWLTNLFKPKKLVAIVPMTLTVIEEDGDQEKLFYTAYCYEQGSARKVKLHGTWWHKRYVKTNHARWSRVVLPWLKFGADSLGEFKCTQSDSKQ